MDKSDEIAKELARIGEAQRRALERLSHDQARVEKRFEHLRERLLKKHGETYGRQQRIIEAALELLKKDGLENLSLRKLAHLLGMQAPALYRHFKNKSELIDYMAEAILQEEFSEVLPRDADEPWQDWLINRMKRLRRAMLAYPDGARVVAGARLDPAVTLAKLNETSLESLISAGISPYTARCVVLTTTHYTFGDAIEEQASPTIEQISALDTRVFLQPYPRIREVLADAQSRGFDTERDFVTGLQYIIDGASQK
jgi:TetR/AcrR family tetracycline transcriptional repressor